MSTKVQDPLAQQIVSHAKDSNTSGGQQFGFSRFLYANLFRRNAVFVAAIFLAAGVGVQVYDAAWQAAWEYNNKGKLFKDIIKDYPGLPPNTEPEGASDAAADEEEESADEPAADEE